MSLMLRVSKYKQMLASYSNFTCLGFTYCDSSTSSRKLLIFTHVALHQIIILPRALKVGLELTTAY